MIEIADGVRVGLKEQHDQAARYAQSEGRAQREFALPRHSGFQQLAIIQEREKRYDEAVATCQEAKRQGWGGDWDKRLERIAKKRAK